MRKITRFFALSLFLLLIPSPTPAIDDANQKAAHLYKIQCDEVLEKRFQLIPWFKTLDQKIAQQAAYDKLIKLLKTHKNKLAWNGVVLTYGIKKSGEIEDLTVYKSSGCCGIDKAAIALVRSASPFTSPPNDLPYSECMATSIMDEHPQSLLATNMRRALPR